MNIKERVEIVVRMQLCMENSEWEEILELAASVNEDELERFTLDQQRKYLFALGKAQRFTGQYSEAIQTFIALERKLMESRDWVESNRVRIATADVKRLSGNPESGRKMLEAAVLTGKQLEDPLGIGMAKLELAKMEKDEEKKIQLLAEARKNLNSVGVLTFQIIRLMGTVTEQEAGLLKSRDPLKAEQNLREMIRRVEQPDVKIRMKHELASYKSNLADVLVFYIGRNLEEAQLLAEEAYYYFSSSGHKRGMFVPALCWSAARIKLGKDASEQMAKLEESWHYVSPVDAEAYGYKEKYDKVKDEYSGKKE